MFMKRRRPTKITDELRTAVTSFCSSGHTSNEAVLHFSISESAVFHILRRAGVRLRRGPKPRDPHHLPVFRDTPKEEKRVRRKANLNRWAKTHPDKMREYARQWRAANLELARRKSREYYHRTQYAKQPKGTMLRLRDGRVLTVV